MSRVQLFNASIDAVTMKDAVETIQDSLYEASKQCRFVVTPNLDHAVMLEHHEGLQRAYEDASLVLADGWPVVLSSRLLGRPLPERVTGSDLVPSVFDACQTSDRELKVYLLGAGPGVAERAADVIHHQWSQVNVVGSYSPPFGFEKDEHETERILDRIRFAKPDLLIVGLGAPKQELWVHQNYQAIEANWALCVGACIDFLAGEKRRAPRWMQTCGLEWSFRLATEPGRLFKRYAFDAIQFPRLLYKEWTSTPAKPTTEVTA